MKENASSGAAAEVPAAAIRLARGPADIELARALFEEYAQWLGVDLCFQGFAEELRTLPGAYAAPLGRLLLVGAPEEAFACIALRPIAAEQQSGAAMTGEIKRLYVQPAHCGEGWGWHLAKTLVDEARAIGYRALVLDTLDWMKPAQGLYSRLGFQPGPRYYGNPLPGAVFMRLELRP